MSKKSHKIISMQIQFLNQCRKELEQDKLSATEYYECKFIKGKLDEIEKELLELKNIR